MPYVNKKKPNKTPIAKPYGSPSPGGTVLSYSPGVAKPYSPASKTVSMEQGKITPTAPALQGVPSGTQGAMPPSYQPPPIQQAPQPVPAKPVGVIGQETSNKPVGVIGYAGQRPADYAAKYGASMEKSMEELSKRDITPDAPIYTQPGYKEAMNRGMSAAMEDAEKTKFRGFDSQDDSDNADELGLDLDQYYDEGDYADEKEGFKDTPYYTSAMEGMENVEGDILTNRKMTLEQASTAAMRQGFMPGSPEYEGAMRDAQNRTSDYTQDLRNQASSGLRESMLDYHEERLGERDTLRSRGWELEDTESQREFQKEFVEFTKTLDIERADSDRLLEQAADNPAVFKELNLAKSQGKDIAEVYAELYEQDSSGVWQVKSAYKLPTTEKQAYLGWLDTYTEISKSVDLGVNKETGEAWTPESKAAWRAEESMKGQEDPVIKAGEERTAKNAIDATLKAKNSGGTGWEKDTTPEMWNDIKNDTFGNRDQFIDTETSILTEKGYNWFDGEDYDSVEKVEGWLGSNGYSKGTVIEHNGKVYKVSFVDVMWDSFLGDQFVKVTIKGDRLDGPGGEADLIAKEFDI